MSDNQTNANVPAPSPTTPTPVKKRGKKWIAPVIILSVIAVAAAAVTIFFYTRSLNSAVPPVFEGTISEPEKFNSYEKLAMDYEAGKIDENTYFTQLFYAEYNSDKLDEKYTSDYKGFTASQNDRLLELLKEHGKDIDEDIIKAYVNEINLSDVKLVSREDTSSRNLNSKAFINSNYTIKLLADDEDSTEETTTAETTVPETTISEEQEALKDIRNHELDRVILSQGGNFLIWYTNTGNDGITDDQARSIADGLEDTTDRYKELFDLDFNYSPTVEISVCKNHRDAADILEENDISTETLYTAMNVYIYDTGEVGTAAVHTKIDGGLSEFIAKFIDEGYVAYPYIKINRSAFDDEERLKQLYNHELFHEYQDIYAREIGNDYSTAPSVYSEACANMASASAAKYTKTTNYLNDWATIYFKSSNTSLQAIQSGGFHGYGAFPYFYAYLQEVEDGAEKLMYAHTTPDPYNYLNTATDAEDLRAVADRLSLYLVTNDFDNNALKSYNPASVKDVLHKHDFDKGGVAAGSYVMYEIKNDVSFTAECKISDYTVLNLYGYKNGKFTKILSDNECIKGDTTAYPRYEKFYIIITNGSLVSSAGYTITATKSESAPNQEFETTFENYKINIEMDVTLAGFTTKTQSQGVIDEKHQKEYLETTINSGDFVTITNYSYTDFYGGKTYTTQIFDSDKWTVGETLSQPVDLGVILDKLNSSKKVEEIDENHFRVKLSKRDLKSMLTNPDTDVSVIIGSVYVDVYTRDGYIERLDYDFSKALLKTLGNVQISMTFSDYDMAGDVNIPQEIINNATEETLTVPEDLESVGEFIEENQSFFDTILNIFGQ